MKKTTKIVLITLISLGILGGGGLLYAGNYLYDLAINPTTDKSMIFDNKETKNKEDLKEKKSTILQDKAASVHIENDGLNLQSYVLDQGADIWVIAVHGYTATAEDSSQAASEFYNRGYNVLAPNLRGHGQSEGNYIGMGWDDRKDILAWIDYLNKTYNSPDIILYGVSMGAATVMNVSGEAMPKNVKLIIEDCGYTSTWDIFSYQLGSLFGLPAHPFLDAANLVTKLRAGYTFTPGPIDQVSKCTIPMLFIHGDQDAFVPSYMVDKLYEKAGGPKEKLIIKGAGHNQSKDVNPDLYWKTIDNFIAAYLK